MNREIKFRAWDKLLNKTADVEVIDYGVKQIKIAYYTNPNLHPFTYYRKFDEVVLMQYTGLKDKNGKEIYEGDVVEQTTGFQNVHIVKYDEADLIPFSYNDMYELLPQLCVVIGNIYENPELVV